jgi:hypothetical protein
MSNYTKTTNFAAKDALSSGDPNKIVKGTEIDAEFNNIATAVATKRDSSQAITLTGDATGSGTTSIAVTVADDSHNHVISNVDGLQTALDAKLASTAYTAADVLTKIKTVDGTGSGLDADKVDGFNISTASSGTDSNTIYFRTTP